MKIEGEIIEFNVQDFVDVFELNAYKERKLGKIVSKAVTTALFEEVKKVADERLHTTKAIYLKGLRLLRDGDEYVLELNGKLANGVESGFNAFDIKLGFERSRKATRTALGGWYLTIPLPVNEEYEKRFENAPDIPEDVYKLINGAEEKAITDVSDSLFSGAEDILSSTFDQFLSSQNVSNLVATNKEKTDIKFIRVSNNSDPLSWLHPGVEARNLFDVAENRLDVNRISEDTAFEALKTMIRY